MILEEHGDVPSGPAGERLAVGIRLLCVGTDPDRLATTASRLEARDDAFEVETARSAVATLERLAEDREYHCVVSESALDETDGLGLLRSVRDREPDVPFILLAGEGDAPVTSEALAAGVTDVVDLDGSRESDPYAVVAHRVRNAVDRHRAERIARQTTKAVDVVDEAMAFFDDCGDLVYANEAYGRLFGETPDAVVGTALGTRFADAERARFETDIHPTVLERGRWTGDARARTTDGREFLAEHVVYRFADGGYLHQAADISAREMRERRLTSFRQAIEHAGHAVMLTDTDGTIEYVNPAFEEMSGYTREEAVGETPALLNSGAHDAAFYDDLWETITDGDVWEGELVNERKDGSHYTISQTIAPIADGDGDRLGFVAINTDITERKERERELAFFEQAMEQIGTGMAAYDEHGRIRYANEHYAQLLGSTREDLLGRHICTVNPDFVREQFPAYWGSFERGETRTRETIHERFDDGTQVPVSTTTTRVRIHDTDYNIGTISDITERKERERDLRTFRQAIEHAGHAVMLTDTDGAIEYVNPAFEADTGYSKDEVVGKTPSILKSGEHDEAFYTDLWETITGGEVWESEVINRRKDGDRYHLEQTIAPIVADDGEIERFVAINTDISDLKEQERELKRQNERLERYGRTVAHDLRNPLNVLEARIEYLETNDVESLDEHCETMHQSIEKMKTLIDELLTLAKHGQTVLEPSALSLEEVAATAWSQSETRTATLLVDDSMLLMADETRLDELFGNLFRNVAEHVGADATVRVGTLDDGFYVADDGPGIPEDERERVLDLGYTTAEEGTGFGLAIVNEIAEAHGWSVRITESAAGGTRFEISQVDRVESAGTRHDE